MPNEGITLILAATLLASAPGLRAQSSAGRISGTVTDSSGAVLPGVTVTVTQQGTGLSRTAAAPQRAARHAGHLLRR